MKLTLTVPSRKFDEPVELQLEGRALIDGHKVIRAGIPAEDMMQAFAYHHLITVDAWMVRVTAPVGRRSTGR